jgi:hypothetical protein
VGGSGVNRQETGLGIKNFTPKFDEILKSLFNDWIPACAGMTAILTI